MTKVELIKKATKKVERMSKEELNKFLTRYNPCHHPKTRPCGMDRVCDRCGDWV